jgi:hypothetical protein
MTKFELVCNLERAAGALYRVIVDLLFVERSGRLVKKLIEARQLVMEVREASDLDVLKSELKRVEDAMVGLGKREYDKEMARRAATGVPR